MSYGKIIKELREERGLSLMALARSIGVSDTAVCKWENEVAEPKLSYILKLADFFGCSADFILGRRDDFGWKAPKSQLPQDERRLLAAYRALPAARRELAIETLEFWKK